MDVPEGGQPLDPGKSCDAEPTNPCGTTGLCGDGACAVTTPGTPCGAATCADKAESEVSLMVCTPNDKSVGTCGKKVQKCGGYACLLHTCYRSCTSIAHCSGGLICKANICDKCTVKEECPAGMNCDKGKCKAP